MTRMRTSFMTMERELAGKIENVEPVLQAVAGQQFFNTSPLTFTKLLDDPNTIADSLRLYIGGFSEAAKDVIDKFDFAVQIERLRKANILYQVVGKFADIDLHPEVAAQSRADTVQRDERCVANALEDRSAHALADEVGGETGHQTGLARPGQSPARVARGGALRRSHRSPQRRATSDRR